MKVLVVGCGAVGQVFSLCLQKAGVDLALYDRPATVARLKQALEGGGLPLFQISYFRRRDPRHHCLRDCRVVADVTECQRFQPDQIWFTIPSPVYYSKWFREFLERVPSERVVCFVPEGPRPEFYPPGSRERLVFAGTTFMAWQGGPQGGGGRPEGVNFWRPPLGIPLMGTKQACREVAQVLKKAGFRVSVGKQDSRGQASVTALMTAFVAGLELSGWSLGAYRRSPWLQRAARASREMVLGQLASTGIFTRALLGMLFSSPGLYLATLLLPLLFPFDLDTYLKFHYRKTRDQTLTLLDVFTRDAKRRGLPVDNARLLLQGLLEMAR